jgi:N-acetylmuramoyl-L-alanine amidase CwlA
MHADYQFGGSGGREASWHYTVDDLEIWQSFEDGQMCWHAGNKAGNEQSIGVEICVNKGAAGFAIACKNAAWLVAELLTRHNLSVAKEVAFSAGQLARCFGLSKKDLDNPKPPSWPPGF